MAEQSEKYGALLIWCKALDAEAETALKKINAALAANQYDAWVETPGRRRQRAAAALGATRAWAE